MPHIERTDGRKIWYDVLGEGQPLVLIGGSSIAHRQWDFMAPILKDHFRLILFDQRGAGLSDRRPEGISLDAWVEDMKAILDFLGVPKAHVLSTSNGSLVAIRFAARYPSRTGAVVHYGIYKLTEQYRKMSKIGQTIVDAFGVGDGGMGAYFLTRMFGTPDLCESWVRNRFDENLSPAPWKAMHAAIDVDLTDDLDKIRAPQLILLGESGPLGEKSDYASGTAELQKAWPGIDVLTIGGSNGTFHVFTRPFECAQAVLNFLGRHSDLIP